MSEVDQLELDMIRLAELKKQLDSYDEIKREYDICRQAVLMGMQASKSKRTEPINGYFAVRSERASIRITDEKAVEKWLKANDFNIDEYKRIDTLRFTPIAKAALKTDGEKVPGTEVELSEYVTIKQETK